MAQWILFLSLPLMMILAVGNSAQAEMPGRGEVCDVEADYALGVENYPEAIRLHLAVIERNPHDAQAHYHLGFAYGMTGLRDRERAEYHEALALGRVEWSLMLNLGLSHLDQGEYQAAIDALTIATLLGPEHAEAHYNLALAYERRAMLSLAEQELFVSLLLDPAQPEARNMLALVHAEQGQRSRAREEWTDLLRGRPDFEPARANLAILDATAPQSPPSPIATEAQIGVR